MAELTTAIANVIVNARFGDLDQGLESRPVNAQGGDETWTVIDQGDGTVAVRSPNGQQWLSIQPDGRWESRPVADPGQPGPWERFTRDGNVLREVPKDGVSRPPVELLTRVTGGAGPVPGPGPIEAPERLTRSGVDLATASQGRVVRLQGASFFAGYWKFLEHGADDIRPALAQLRDRWQANVVLVFGMSVNVQANLFGAPPFDPSKYGPAYLEQWPAFLALCAEFGMYVYWVAFPDHGLIPAYEFTEPCRDLWNGLLEAGRPAPNLILKPTNEGGVKGYNYINPHALAFPDFCPVAALDYGVDDPAWSAGTFPDGSDWGGDRSCGDLHTPRDGAATVLDCACVNNVYYKAGRPVFISEPIRMGSNGSAGVTRELARLVGLASRTGPALRIFHSLQGEKADVYDGETTDHADAYFTGI